MDRPLVLLGHSGGALAAYLLAIRHPETASTLVLSGAPLRPVDWALAQLAGDVDESEDLDPTMLLSAHPDYIHALMHDPLTYKGGFRNVTLEAVVRTWPEVATAFGRRSAGRPRAARAR